MSRWAFGAGSWIARAATATWKGVFTFFQVSVSGMWLVVAIQAIVIALSPNWRRAFQDGTVDVYFRIVDEVMEGRVPLAWMGFTLHGVFAVLLTGVALGLGGLLVVMAGLLLALPMTGVFVFASSAADALRKAERAKTQEIAHAGEVGPAVTAIERQGRETFAPRLVVLRVATPAWQQAVSALAASSAATIVDISEPTKHLLWELDELERLGAGRTIFVAEHARVLAWSETRESGEAGNTLEQRFARQLASRMVLAYTTDRRGMRRFARALHGMLLDVEDGDRGRYGVQAG
jgi:hypothetical protein